LNSSTNLKKITPIATEGQFGQVGRLGESTRIFQELNLAENELEPEELEGVKANVQQRFDVLEKLRLPFLIEHVKLKVGNSKIRVETEQPTTFLRSMIRDDEGLLVAEGQFREIAYQLLKALSELHSRNVFFGELNLADVLIKDRTPSDDSEFEGRHTIELSNPVLGGIPHYSNGRIFRENLEDPIVFPPESSNSPPEPNARADLYCAGMILCQIAGGRQAATNVDKSQWTSRVPKSLVGFVQNLMADDPSMRPHDATEALVCFDKVVDDRNKLGWRAWTALAAAVLLVFVAGRWHRGSIAVKAQDDLQGKIGELKVERDRFEDGNQHLVAENKRLEKLLGVAQREPNESEVHDAALEIFNRLSKLRDLNNEGDWVTREIDKLSSKKLQEKVDKKLGGWLNRLSSRQKWTLKFAKDKSGKHEDFDFYGYVLVDDKAFKFEKKYLSDVKFQWKPGESIKFFVYCNDNGLDSEVKEIILEGQYAIWDLHRQGMGLDGKYDSKNWHFEFEVSEWKAKTLPDREGKKMLPTSGF